MKTKSIWYCSSCGHSSTRWIGQCPTCSEWNSFHEEQTFKEKKTPSREPSPLKQIQETQFDRYQTSFSELNRTLGGGLVPGALILLGGDPGIGKSTLSLQIANSLPSKRVLYISGEESLEQIAIRARRLQVSSDNILFSNETEVNAIEQWLKNHKPDLVIIDSIQILYKHEIASSPGSVVQVRECTAALMQIAKSLHITMIIIGHVTKTGEIAGPRILEHLVDTVLYFEGEQQQNLRIIRSIKNRFGPTDEISVFHMQNAGLKEVKNPSQLFIEDRTRGTPGTVIMPIMEGSRPILIEAQALVTKTFYPTPSRRSTGIDPNRLALLIAVCEKRARLRLYQSDVFVSITGGLRINEPAADLGLLLSIASSFSNRIFDPDTAVIGEVGLGGEVRSVPRIEARVKEASLMGFKRCILPTKNVASVRSFERDVALCPVSWVEEAIEMISHKN